MTSKKLYEQIAEAISREVALIERMRAGSSREAHDDYSSQLHGVNLVVRGVLAPIFKADNDRFDRERFLKACGVWSALDADAKALAEEQRLYKLPHMSGD